jgi:hypothetical protein
MHRYDEINWNKGECNGAPLNLFYILEENRKAADWLDPEAIRRICGGCSIWNKCLSYAMGNENYGMWGGLLTKERNALKQRDGSQLREEAITHLTKYGITREEIEEIANEHSSDERGLENQPTDDREDDFAGDS